MTLVNAETGELIEPPTYGEVKDSISKAKASLEAAAEQIVWQIERQAWSVLGYSGWNEMREAEYGGAAFMVPRAERPELVARMRASGLTQQEIADTAGVNIATVSRDLANASSDCDRPVPLTIVNTRGQSRPTSYAPKPVPGPTIDDAVREFPDLAHYAETDPSRVLLMADDLRRYRELGELDLRLDNLRRSIAVDKAKRNGTHRPGTTAVMGDDGVYEMKPLPTPAPVTRTCPTCNGAGRIQEQS